MRIMIESEIARKISDFKEDKHREQILLEISMELGIVEDLEIEMNWSSLFELFNLRKIFDNFPKFDQSKLFTQIVTSLTFSLNKEDWIYLYDQIFVDCITNVKDLPQINRDFLLEQIRKTKKINQSPELFLSLERYEKRFTEEPGKTMHDLVLYLAWDRMCVNMAILFEYNFQEVDVTKGLDVFKECLLESFQHITHQGKSTPGFFRLVEALYALQMREERLNTHTELDWQVLCQGSKALMPREEMIDIPYIDAIVVHHDQLNTIDIPLRILTIDSVEKVKVTLMLTRYMMDKLKNEEKDWKYTFKPFEIICLNESEKGFFIEEIIKE